MAARARWRIVGVSGNVLRRAAFGLAQPCATAFAHGMSRPHESTRDTVHEPSRALLQRCRTGDAGALATLMDQSRVFVRRYVSTRLGPRLRARAEVDDYVQEAIVRTFEFAPQIEPCDTAQLHGLLARIADNVLRDQHEHHGAQCRSPDAETRLTGTGLHHPADTATTPGSVAGRREDHSWVRLAVELLEPEDRVVVMRHEWHGETFAAIGARLGVGENAARMRFQRALPKLLKKVQLLRAGRLDEACRP